MYALDEEGKIYAWGYNYSGQLGDGTTTNRSTPICISEISGNPLKNKKIVKISGGLYRNAVALDEEGKVYTWGDNYYGQLGDGTTTNSSTPICISEIEESPLKGKKIVDIYASRGIDALDDEGNLYIWGKNNYNDGYKTMPTYINGNFYNKRVEKMAYGNSGYR